MKRIGIYANVSKPKAIEVARDSVSILKKLHAEPILSQSLQHLIHGTVNIFEDFNEPELLDNQEIRYDNSLIDVDAILVIGGDGTILSQAVWAAEHEIPILGVNLGQVGFLANIEPDELQASLEKLVLDQFVPYYRMLLRAKIGEKSYVAVNEFLLYKQHFSNTIKVHVNINGVTMAQYLSDGVMVSTPVGSTAYALSAGGPIIAPNVNAMLITPVCPHALSARPILVSKEDEISIRILDGKCKTAQLIVDGVCIREEFTQDEEILIRPCDKRICFLNVNDYNFFELVRQKLY